MFAVPVAAATIFSLHVLPVLRCGGADAPRATAEAAAAESSLAAGDGVQIKVRNPYDGDVRGDKRNNHGTTATDRLAEPHRVTTLQIEAWPGMMQTAESKEFR